MTSEHKPSEDPGDPFSQLQTYFVTEVNPRDRQEIINGFTRLAEKTELRNRHQERLQKMKAFCGSRRFQSAVGLAVVAGIICGAVEIGRAEGQKSHRDEVKSKAEAIVRVLRSADAIRALNLTPDALLAAQHDADLRADSSTDKEAITGYADLVHLYGTAASLATKAHNASATVDEFIGYPSYIVYVDHDNQNVRETAADIVDVSQDVAVAIDEFLQ